MWEGWEHWDAAKTNNLKITSGHENAAGKFNKMEDGVRCVRERIRNKAIITAESLPELAAIKLQL
jgi:hypothetical protein